MSADESVSVPRKRHKTVGGLRLHKPSPASVAADSADSDSDACGLGNPQQPHDWTKDRVRECHISTRLPQRRNPAKDIAVPVAKPTSADKFISGIWRQLHSPISLTFPTPVCTDGLGLGM